MAIYDCFTFFNEIELLDIRLNLLNDVVDYFVIVEMNQTFRGKKKAFIFEENKEKFKKYINKIIYIKVEDIIEYDNNICIKGKNDIITGDWSLEFFQRNAINRGLIKCNLNDLIMISDIDEIPNPNIIKNLLNRKVYIRRKNYWRTKIKLIYKLIKINFLYLFKEVKVKDIIDLMPISLEQNMYYYYLNGKISTKWYGTVICKYKNIETPQSLRNDRNKLFTIRNGGWHFSYLGGIEKIQKKISSIVEGNPNKSGKGYIERCLENGEDIYGRKNMKIKYIDKSDIGLKNIDKFIKKYPYLYKKE